MPRLTTSAAKRAVLFSTTAWASGLLLVASIAPILRMRTRGESKEIFLTDPDNISVQLTDTSYCGGSGIRGNKC